MPSAIVNLAARMFAANRSLLSFWARRARVAAQGETPWTPFSKDPGECVVALVTTAGVHRRSDAPFDMADRRGDPTWREIPADTPAEALMVTHDYYDHRDADSDVNVVLPLDRLREMAAAGHIGGIAPAHYSFMGHIKEPHVRTLATRTSLEVADRLSRARADLVLLSPA